MSVAARERKMWRPEEVERLAAMAGRVDLATMMAELGRSRFAIRAKRQALGLGPIAGERTPTERGLCLVDVARILGTTRKAVRRLIASGALEGHQSADRISNGAIWRVHPSSLAEFLRERPERYDLARIADPAWRAIAAAPRRRPNLAGERLLSVEEVAPLLFMGGPGVRMAIRRGDLQAVLCRNRRGTSWYVLESSVRAYRPPAIVGRSGIDAETAARRARVLAERGALQERFDAGAPAVVAKPRGGRRAAQE